jgi:hypothetical protein
MNLQELIIKRTIPDAAGFTVFSKAYSKFLRKETILSVFFKKSGYFCTPQKTNSVKNNSI